MNYKGRLVTISIILIYAVFQVTVLNEPVKKQLFDSIFALLLAVFFGYHYDRMTFLAEKDFLTQTYNRRYANKEFPKIKRKMIKEKNTLSLFVVDVNNFKKINDNYGHETGDTVLKRIANILLTNTSKEDLVVRWGGDEFIIIAPISNKNNAKYLIEKIKDSFKEQLKEYEDNNLGLSIGYAIFPEDGENLDDLLKVADTYMYKIKHNIMVSS